ncbi:PilC/PilY family type IV pilus protein [Acinetobacter sp. ANC 3791]|uniref:PilC/PilY family type IV pilus protein n=1 Tax=Acinetobacter sp. ANC 3791 TaxID=2529836 RepID=UPI001038711D|nr:PilC/PilY family type IV pilus protein [Acinetobacter sp. ANC 3791]TCB84857.1 pilus assembly protein PilY [Acinetobacter sp. ANC 3791]
MKKLKKLSDYYCHLRKFMVSGGAALLSLFMCFSSPAVYASDISIYQAAKYGTITLMLMLDTSGSMGPTKSSSGYSFADDYGLTNCGTSSQTTLPTNGNSLSSFSNNTAYYVTSSTTPSYSRNFCYVSSSTATTTVKNSCELQSNGGYRCYDRLTRLKDGVFDLLNGNATKNITALSDDKIIGLSTFSYNGAGNAGYIVVPALSLGSTVGTITQRQTLLNAISTLTATGGTPTANAYADVGAYMMGTNTLPTYAATNLPIYFSYVSSNKTYYQSCKTYNSSYNGCSSWNSATQTSPLGNGGYTSTAACKVGSNTGTCYNFTGTLLGSNSYSGFPYSSIAWNSAQTAYAAPDSITSQLTSTSTTQCSGQGIYVLTDGVPNSSNISIAKPLMQNALGGSTSYGNTLTCSGKLFTDSSDSTGWQCISDFSQLLLNRNIDGSSSTAQMNPLGLSIKTAVVGFGNNFSGMTSYSTTLSQAANLANITNSNVSSDAKNTAYWGVYGQGGWYAGSNSSDVVNSINNFINTLSTDIPPVTTGSATIPTDKLNPTAVQNYAYFSQFQPTPDKTYQLWQGNLKKYNVLNGYITDASGNSVVDSTGKIVTNTDLWTNSTSTSKAYGGVKGVLPLGANSSNTANRTLLIDRDSSGNTTGTTLNQIDVGYLNTTTDSARGYLLALLGFAVDPNNLPASTSTLISSGELRQIGAVMHSAPILLTSSGTITTNTDGSIGTNNRSDYVLFGSTQGLLHVVDATTGTEQFAFVPNEMVTKQKNAFLKYDSTTGGTAALYYGVDASWEVYSEYVPNSDGSLTVGTGMGGATGKQMAYGGLRMGGRSYYALNLQNISSPSIKFHIDPDNSKVWYNGSSTTYKELAFMGQSWSKPSIGWVRWNGSKRLVMFVGGGYDAGGTNGDGTFATDGSRTGYAGYEGTTYSQTNKIGAGMYMFDALTGQLLWWTGANATASNTTAGVQYTTAANMQYSVVSQIKTVDRNSDGLIDHLYFGDLGGQVWRVDLNNNAPAVSAFAKTPVRLLNLNNGQYSPRFYETPGFSTYNSSGTIFGVVSIGSGNLSSPLFDTASSSNSNYNNDAIYNIYDKDVARSDLYNYTTTTSGGTTSYSYSSSMNTHDLTLATSTASPTTSQLLPLTDTTRASNATIVAPYSTTGGWYYAFASSMIQDEKVLSTPLVINNDMYVTTFDGSKDGLSGTCGAGVKGNSFVTQFCMPYGQCSSSVYTSSSFINHTNIGAGIVAPSVGSTNSTGSTRTLVTASGNLSSNRKIYSTSLSLIPQRWYEASQ